MQDLFKAFSVQAERANHINRLGNVGVKLYFRLEISPLLA